MRLLWSAWLLFAMAARPSAAPTFGRDVAPILYRSCVPCHRPGESGPFSLLSYDDARRHARQIAEVTRRRIMPPWLPEAGYGEFQNQQTLTVKEIQVISDWVQAGVPEGPPGEIPPPPKLTDGWQLGPPDEVLTAPKPFLLPASGPDPFWNFVFTSSQKTRRYVQAIEIRPGNKKIVHHANLLVDRGGMSKLREVSPGAGFPGMDLSLERTTFDFDTHFLFWKPGTSPSREPDEMAWKLDPGTTLVLNTHLRPSGKAEQAQPTIGLYFTDRPPTSFPMLIQLEHDGELDIPAGARDFAVSDDFRLPVDMDVLAIYPHAHYLGKRLEAYATLPDGTRCPLIRIPDWDLNWQAVYRYRKPVFLPRGSVIAMRYRYDNSAANPRNPNHPPKRVRAGNEANDEMAHLWLQILPRAKGDRRMEIEEALMRHRLEKYPDDYLAHLKLGAVMLARLNAVGASPMLEAAVKAEPNQPEAHNLYGASLVRLGRTQDAIREFRDALRLRPNYHNARFNLANALTASGKIEDAIAEYRKLLEVYPNDENVRDRLKRAQELLRTRQR